jgi:cell division protein FtsQ
VKLVAKPYRNQRVSRPHHRRQQHLLEVSIRASKAREQRVRKALAVTFKLIVLGAVLAGLWIGAREGTQRFFWENKALFLTDIRVQRDGTLTREQIISTAGIVVGENIFKTDLSAARKALDRLPQVERVEMQRTLPNRIDIVITERRPIAWVVARNDVDPTSSDKAFLVDARGYVMKARKLLPEYYHLPIISGVETENLVAGQKVTTIEMQSALELLRLNADSTRWQARNIDLAKGYCLVVTDRNKSQITFGLDRVEAQLGRLYRLLDYVQQTQQEIRTVNLFVERNTPVTFHEPEPVEPELTGAAGEVAKPPVPVAVAPPKPAPRATPAPTPSSRRKPTNSSSPRKPTPAKKSSVESLKRPFRT